MPENEGKIKSVVICSGQLNRYGYRILPEGIDFSAYLNNPVLLYMHGTDDIDDVINKGKKAEELLMPIGRCENIRLEKCQLLGDPVFDEGDEFAKEVKRKWDAGFLNAVSMGFDFKEFSDDPQYIVIGQKLATVTKSELLELSIVVIPGDRDAVRLTLQAGKKPTDIIPKIQIDNNNQTTVKKMDKKKLAGMLGLADDCKEEDIESAIATLKKAKTDACLALGRQKGIVTDANITDMTKIVERDPETVRLSWSVLPDAKLETPKDTATLAATIRSQGTNPGKKDERSDWTLKDWRQKDPQGFLSLERKDPEKFVELVKSVVGSGKAADDNYGILV